MEDKPYVICHYQHPYCTTGDFSVVVLVRFGNCPLHFLLPFGITFSSHERFRQLSSGHNETLVEKIDCRKKIRMIHKRHSFQNSMLR